jgi:photosystem II stability/assembly factor-like uncharacterized protein
VQYGVTAKRFLAGVVALAAGCGEGGRAPGPSTDDAAAVNDAPPAARYDALPAGAPDVRPPGASSDAPSGGTGRDAAEPPATGPAWVNLHSTFAAGQSVSGLVYSLRVDPRDGNVVYVATSAGGIWKTKNYLSDRPTWQPLSEGFEWLETGAVELDPKAPDTVYAGLLGPYYIGIFLKSTDGGATWSKGQMLTATYPAAAGSQMVAARRVWELRVDPTNPAVVFVATDVGLFRSSDRGATFALIDMPNVPMQTSETIHSLVYVGGSPSVWIASGVPRCMGCVGDLWRSTDGGLTWSSGRAASAFPVPPTELARMTAAVGNTADPNRTVVFVEATDPTGAHTTILRSVDGGQHYDSPSGPVTGGGCGSTDGIVGNQGAYNQAVAVDPTDANHVIFGGQVCHVRSLNALAPVPEWSNAAPGVHPDWHEAIVTNIGGQLRVYSGNDGGIYSSTNVFTPGAAVSWRAENRGLYTLLTNTVGSGDPVAGNPDIFLTGLQDNGSMAAALNGATWSFTTVTGGDGKGAATNKGTRGEFVWSSIDSPSLCVRAGATTCLRSADFRGVAIPFTPDDMRSSRIRLAPIQTDPTGVGFLTISKLNVWRSNETPGWDLISGTHCQGADCATGSFPFTPRAVVASQTIPGLYGVSFAEGRVAVTSDGQSAQPRWTISVPLPLASTCGVAFPPARPAGSNAGDVYLTCSEVQATSPMGHLFVTRDRGATFQPLRGEPGAELPDVAVRAVRHDHSDMSGNTIYVATDVGVYRTLDGGKTWYRFGTGPAAREGHRSLRRP